MCMCVMHNCGHLTPVVGRCTVYCVVCTVVLLCAVVLVIISVSHCCVVLAVFSQEDDVSKRTGGGRWRMLHVYIRPFGRKKYCGCVVCGFCNFLFDMLGVVFKIGVLINGFVVLFFNLCWNCVRNVLERV